MDVIKKLEPIILSGALPHAVLFEGENRYEASKYFAAAVVCSGEKKPCKACVHCKKAENGSHPDIKELFPSGAMKSYPIKDIREIKHDAVIKPNEADKKVYILNDVDNIAEISQNALLKILEEPPEKVVFVLNCMQKSHLLDTVISRVTVFSGGDEKADEQDEDTVQLAKDIINTALGEKEFYLLEKLQTLSSDKNFRLSVFECMREYLRQLYKIKCGAEIGENSVICENLTINNILNALEALECARKSTLRNGSVMLTITKLSADLKSALGR